jgi:hypothetical protein
VAYEHKWKIVVLGRPEDEGKKHLNFGFAPYTEGQYELPYLYAYAYPYPEPFEAPPVRNPPSGTRKAGGGWWCATKT